MKVKKLFGTAALTVGLLALASCGGTNEPKDSSTTPTGSESSKPTTTPTTTGGSSEVKTITLVTSAGDDLQKILNAAKAEFEAENKNFKVNIVTATGYDAIKSKVTSDLVAGQQPSMAYCYGDHVASYLSTGKVLALDDYINNSQYGLDLNDLLYTDEMAVFGDGKKYTLPMSKSTDALYFNSSVITPELLATLDIDFNNPAKWTWNKMWQLCAKLKEMYPKSTPLGYDSEANWVITYLEALGARDGKKYYTDASQEDEDKILFNNAKTKEIFATANEKYEAGLLTTKGTYGSYTSGLFTQYKSTTAAKDYAGSFMSIGSTGGASHQLPAEDDQTHLRPFTVGLAPMPSVDGTAKTVKQISQGPSLVLFDQGDKDLALGTWLFAKKLLSADVQAAYAAKSGGYSPVSKKALTTLTASLDTTDPAQKLNKDCLDLMNKLYSEHSLYVSDCFDASAVAREEIGKALINVLKATNKSNIEKTISNAITGAYLEVVDKL